MIELIMACAPNVHPTTIQEIIRVESEGNPLAVNINKKQGRRLKVLIPIKTVPDAVAVAKASIQLGHSVDLGYMQVSSPNLKDLGYTVEDMFDTCKNIAAGAKIFTQFYVAALRVYKNEQKAMIAALSAYNTGSFIDGIENGYVARYVRRK